MRSKMVTILVIIGFACFFTIPLISNRVDNPLSKGLFFFGLTAGSIGFILHLRGIPNTRDRMSLLIPIGGMILYYVIKILGRMF